MLKLNHEHSSKKSKNFLKRDVRGKLIFLNLYPKFFHNTGIKSIYSKLVFLEY